MLNNQEATNVDTAENSAGTIGGSGYFKNLFPIPLPPNLYGTLLINRAAEKAGMKAVVFSHWLHRMKYTCRVCHSELEFAMRVNSTGITEMGT